MQDEIKSFVYYGSENYISLSSLRFMVPGAYLFLSFFAFVAGIVGDAMPATFAFFTIVVFYAIIVYTFHLWCPSPSFACRFVMSAFSSLSIGIIFQTWMYTVLFAANQIDIIDVLIIITLQAVSAAIYYFVTKTRISKGKFSVKKAYKTNGAIGAIGGASYGGIRYRRRLSGMSSSLAATLAMILFTVLAILCVVIATMHLMKYYFCRKYNIDCDENGGTLSPLLFAEKKEKKSLPKRIGSVVWKVSILLLLAAVLYGVYQVSHQSPA